MGPSSGTICTALQQLTTAQCRREGPGCWAARTFLRQPFACSQASSSFAVACQALLWHQACSWLCVETDNLGHSGGGGQLKNPNGQIEGCFAAQWLNTLSSYLRQTSFPRLGCMCHRVRQNRCQGMPISSLSCRAVGLFGSVGTRVPGTEHRDFTALAGWME